MNLKKTDKIIAGVAVLVLIVAAIGIIFYTTYEGDDEPIDEKPSINKYDVTWEFNNKTTTFEGYAGKKSTYEEAISLSAPSGSVLTGINVKVNWQDDKTYKQFIIFGKVKGLDTLTAEILCGGSTGTIESIGEGTDDDKVSFSVNSRPSSEVIEAESVSEVIDILDQDYSSKSDATLDAKVTVSPGESFFRLLKYLLDKGNDFELEVEYEYYTYSIEEQESNDDGTKETVLSSGAVNLGEYRKMVSSGRGWI